MRLAIFDMDGTLIDSLMLWDVIWNEFGKRFLNGKEFSPSKEVRDYAKTCTLKEALELIHSRYGIGIDAQELLETAHELIRDFYGNTVELKPGAKEFLEYCTQKEIPVCLASATEVQLIEIALKHCEIDQYLPKIFSCAVIGKGKEEPDVFLAACRYYGVDVSEAWVFEDSLVALETAKKAGMKTVGIYDQYHNNQAQVKEASVVYVGENETMMKLVGDIV